MVSWRSAFYLLGNLLAAPGMLMLIPMMVDISNGEDSWIHFLNGFITTIFISGFLILATKSNELKIYKTKEFVIAVTMFWFIGSIFMAFPLIHSSLPYTFFDCYFEVVSSITTTGSTVIYDFNSVPRSFIVWRAILQLIGASLFVASSYYIIRSVYEVSNQENGLIVIYHPKYDTSSILRSTRLIAVTYVTFTILGAMLFAVINESNFLDSFYIASSIFSTSGIPYKDVILAPNYSVMSICIIFIFISGLPINSLISALKGNWRALVNNIQVKIYCSLICICFLLLLFTHGIEFSAINFDLLVCSLSAFTTNGLQIEVDHQARVITYLLSFIGGCSGSATGGIKIFRICIAFIMLRKTISEMAHTDSIYITKNRSITFEKGIVRQTLSYFVVIAISIAIFSFLLSITGISFPEAVSYAYTSATNNSLATINSYLSPTDIYSMSEFAKMILSVAMICGRLEFIPICAILTKSFWRK